MTLDMTDPQSIATWFKASPERHGPLLRRWLANDLWAVFWPAITAARELIR